MTLLSRTTRLLAAAGTAVAATALTVSAATAAAAPAGAPAATANSNKVVQQLQAAGLASTIALSNCSASLVRYPSSLDSDRAMMLTNGHCYEGGFLSAGQVLVNRTSSPHRQAAQRQRHGGGHRQGRPGALRHHDRHRRHPVPADPDLRPDHSSHRPRPP